MWTPAAQDRALGLRVMKDRLCACGCGQKAIDTQREPDEPHPAWDVHTKQCTARAAVDAVRRALHDEKNPEPKVKPTDGLIAWPTPRKEDE